MSERRARRARRPSGLRAEIQRSGALLERWLTYEFERYFDPSIRGARYRGLRTAVWLLGLGVVAFAIHMLLVIDPIIVAAAPLSLAALIEAGIISAVRIGLIVGIASLFGLQLAGDYLADIFELKQKRVAWNFLRSLIGGSSREVVHLRDGKIADEDRNSPIILIGGPGYVVTDRDTAALFERPDGTTHIVGPGSGAEATRPALLTGFERIREPVVNLRDQYIGSLGGAPLTVVSRSLDGIPVSAVDVRGVYSLRRKRMDDAERGPDEEPYPFEPAALESLIYRQSVPVLTEGPNPSGLPGEWGSTMIELIRSSLAEFMSHNRLDEYMAGVSDRESELSQFREDTILTETLRLATDVSEINTATQKREGKFHSRTELTARFLNENEGFARMATEHGLMLHWIGVGTWKMPEESSGEIVRQKHVEAWQMHREATTRADPKSLESVRQGAVAEEKLRLVREVPLASHQRNQARYQDKDVLVECLLQDFWEQMGDVLNAGYESGLLSADQMKLERAVAAIEDLLKIRQLGYLVGGGSMSRVRPKLIKRETPPAPSSRMEAQRYQALLGKLGGDYKAAEGMIASESKRHRNLTREQLIQRILVRFERYGR